jgi:hypothetical protein
METYIPEIEENISIPARTAEAMPELTKQEEIEMRARTIKLLSDLNCIPVIPSNDNIDQAEKLANQMITDPHIRPDYARYPNETIAYLAGMVSQMNCAIVDELADLKLYVVNKLVYEVEHNQDNPKIRLMALSKLGEVDGVDAFKRRTETTHLIKPIEEVEKELLSVLNNVEYKLLERKGNGIEIESKDETNRGVSEVNGEFRDQSETEL